MQEQTRAFVIQLGKKLKEMKDKGLITPPKDVPKVEGANGEDDEGKKKEKKPASKDIVSMKVEDFLEGEKRDKA